MKVYQINYDLRKQRDYAALYERIKAYGTWCHPLESTWVIASQQTAEQVRNNLVQVMDSDDGLFVTRLQGEAAWRGLDDSSSKWLQKQLNAATA
ncbi:hypothetical protein JYT97_03945 [Haliea sp. AH-315-K21]|uniref:SinR family protein n=1 Tax=SAR86 cluster bacterium TaxID=2030880 RepID=A0A2A5CHH2_9GAMM|nr:hypothetical protein [Haliea sp. AH-315-K21]PCJ43319.1 MAG: hypothetical protein COA71_00105 [SAR86 cluster bacterium]